MGIHKLNQLLNHKRLSAERESLLDDVTLLIDGNGWMFHLLDQLPLHNFREFGGYYIELDALIKGEILNLNGRLGFKTIVYFDGHSSALKSLTRRDRLIEKNQTYLNLFGVLSDGQKGRKQGQDDLPIPVLVFDQLKSSLAELCVPVIQCDREADQEIAIACSESIFKYGYNAQVFVYANDR
jgi:hypothetical protein